MNRRKRYEKAMMILEELKTELPPTAAAQILLAMKSLKRARRLEAACIQLEARQPLSASPSAPSASTHPATIWASSRRSAGYSPKATSPSSGSR